MICERPAILLQGVFCFNFYFNLAIIKQSLRPLNFIAIIATAALSCHRSTPSTDRKVNTAKHNFILSSVKKDTIPVLDTTEKIAEYSYEHLFSDTIKSDKFLITLYGKSMLKGTILFKIINSRHIVLFRDAFPATDLLGDMEDVLNRQQQIDTIKSRMVSFFDTRRFGSPAIASNETIDTDLDSATEVEREDWNTIKADKSSVAFFYSHGYEGTYGIAFQKKKQRVVSIFYSD